jgi:2-oxo-3-(phosphooxy)propyl 3-oxoalkanoate synthase
VSVSPDLVHCCDPARVLVTGISRTAVDTFALTAHWPTPDPMLIPETMRQAGIAVAHFGYDVADGTQFVMGDIRFRALHPLAPGPVDLTVVCTDVEQKAGALRRCRFVVTLRQNYWILATGSGGLTCLPPEVWKRLRTRRPTRQSSFSATPVLVDPATFDHPLDHIPGMVQLEAFRRAAEGLTGNRLVGCEVEFLGAVPLGTPVWCWAHALDLCTVAVELRDGAGTPFTTGTVNLEES